MKTPNQIRLPDGKQYDRDELERVAPGLVAFIDSGEPLLEKTRLTEHPAPPGAGPPTRLLKSILIVALLTAVGAVAALFMWKYGPYATRFEVVGLVIGFGWFALHMLIVHHEAERQLKASCTLRVEDGCARIAYNELFDSLDHPRRTDAGRYDRVELTAPLDHCRWRIGSYTRPVEAIFLEGYDPRRKRRFTVVCDEKLPNPSEPSYATWRSFLEVAGVRQSIDMQTLQENTAAAEYLLVFGALIAALLSIAFGLYPWAIVGLAWLAVVATQWAEIRKQPDWAFDGDCRIDGPRSAISGFLKPAITPSILYLLVTMRSWLHALLLLVFLGANAALGALVGRYVRTKRQRLADEVLCQSQNSPGRCADLSF